MRNLPRSLLQLTHDPEFLCVCESLRNNGYQPGVQGLDWTKEDLERIRLVLRKLTALRVDNPEDAEDLVQDTLLTLVRKAPEIILEKGPMIWAMGILRKKVGNYYRKVQRCAALEEYYAATRGRRARMPAVLTPEMNLHHDELRSLVDGALARLSPREREALDLSLSGRPTAEIVSLLHPERYQNIVNRLHRGRKKLARELARHGYTIRGSRKARPARRRA
jgi:RNA polymerase sigma-70 factor (ECF subfamily)